MRSASLQPFRKARSALAIALLRAASTEEVQSARIIWSYFWMLFHVRLKRSRSTFRPRTRERCVGEARARAEVWRWTGCSARSARGPHSERKLRKFRQGAALNDTW